MHAGRATEDIKHIEQTKSVGGNTGKANKDMGMQEELEASSQFCKEVETSHCMCGS